ncbi:MAG: D-alanyl-D-alanine carboxypeptidase family protein [Oceanococcaceae bacterium]
MVGAVLSPLAQAAPLPPPRPPNVDARQFLLMDYASQQIIAEQSADERADPASITKLMTAYVVFDALAQGLMQDTDLVTISRKAWKAEGSRMFAEVNTQVSIQDLLRGLIVQSGNDAAIALAEHTAGSEGSFADRMNQYAAQLGLKNTHYTNASGLSDPEHYTTARDIALLVHALVSRFPQRYKLYSEREFTYNGISQSNRNQLLWRDASVDGVKTGYTSTAGYCLASSALRDGMRLIAVVLGAPNANGRISASEALLNWGFRFYESVEVAAAGATVNSSRIYKGSQEQLPLGRLQSTWVVVPRGQAASVELDQDVPAPLMAPVTRGQTVGELIVRHQGRELTRLPLQGLSDVPLGSFWQRLRDEALLAIGG